jgi:hypothetical protein
MDKKNIFLVNNKPTFHDSFCVYMDVLGFEKMIEESKDNGKKLFKRFHKIVSNNIAKLKKYDEWEIKTFTDNIVLGYPRYSYDGEIEFANIFFKIGDFQLSMALEGFFIRGGISIGQLFMDENVVFGPALLDARKIEDEISRDPRIVLSQHVYEIIRNCCTRYFAEPYFSPHNKTILIDPDGQPYLNYLDCLVEEDTGGLIFNWQGIKKHKKQIEFNLKRYRSNPKIWAKYHWLVNYHNYFCNQYNDIKEFKKNKRMYLINENLMKKYPSRMIEE